MPGRPILYQVMTRRCQLYRGFYAGKCKLSVSGPQ